MTPRTLIPAGALDPIETRADAERFVTLMHNAGLMPHFDDSPDSLVDMATGERTWTNGQAYLLAAQYDRVADVWGLAADDCPNGLLLKLYEAEEASKAADLPMVYEFRLRVAVTDLPKLLAYAAASVAFETLPDPFPTSETVTQEDMEEILTSLLTPSFEASMTMGIEPADASTEAVA